MPRRFDPVLLDAFLAESRLTLASADEAIGAAGQQPTAQAQIRLEATLAAVDQLRQSAVFLKAEAVVAAATAVEVALQDRVHGVTAAEPVGLDQLRADLQSLSELIDDLESAPRRQRPDVADAPGQAPPSGAGDGASAADDRSSGLAKAARTGGYPDRTGGAPPTPVTLRVDLDAADAIDAPPGQGVSEAEADDGLGVTPDLLDQVARAAGLDGEPVDGGPGLVDFDAVLADALSELDAEMQGQEVAARDHEPAASPPPPAEQPAIPTGLTAQPPAPVADASVRIEADRLEDLVDLVGQLVLCKNRVVMLAAENRAAPSPALGQRLQAAATELDHVSALLQVAVMRTQLQAIGQVLDQAPAVVDRLARGAGREAVVTIEGGEIEVDRGVIENLAEPLMHLMRVITLRSIETAVDREAAGKPALATVSLVVTHQGSHVMLRLQDDGAGLSGSRPVRITSQADLPELGDDDRDALAPAVAGLEGLDARFELVSRPGVGVTCEIAVALNTAIMKAMMIRCGRNVYALPLSCLLEVARPSPDQLSTVQGAPLLSLRGAVHAVVDLRDELAEPRGEQGDLCVAMVQVSGVAVALVIDEAIGQRDVVIKPLEHPCTMRGPFSGATIRDDGAVSLILDPLKLLARHIAPRSLAA